MEPKSSSTSTNPGPSRLRHIGVGGKARSVRVPDDLWEEAQAIAEARGEPLSEVIRQALEEYVKRAK